MYFRKYGFYEIRIGKEKEWREWDVKLIDEMVRKLIEFGRDF